METRSVGSKVCRRCRCEKSLDDFWTDKRVRDQRMARCKDCVRAYRSQRPAARKPYVRMHTLKKLYGITPEDYDAMYEAQGGRCGVCGVEKGKQNFHIDHDHGTGEVRGLLCLSCNAGMGQLGDDATRLRAAADWIERGGSRGG
jgi:hypothetical protein